MNLERAINLTKTFRNNVKDCTPEFVGKMEIKLVYIREGYNVHITINEKEYKLSRLEDFFIKFISNNIITLKDNVIQEDYVFTYEGLITKEEFEKAQKIIEENVVDDSDIITPRNLIEGETYQLKDGKIIYHLGIYMKNVECYCFSSSSGIPKLEKNKINNAHRYFIELKKQDDGTYKPFKMFTRKTKDIVIKALNINIDEEKIETFILSNMTYSGYFSIISPKSIARRELLSNPENNYTYNYSLFKKDNQYYIGTGRTWNKQLYKVKDYLYFKSEFSKFRQDNRNNLDLMEFLEIIDEPNFDGLETVYYFYERG